MVRDVSIAVENFHYRHKDFVFCPEVSGHQVTNAFEVSRRETRGKGT